MPELPEVETVRRTLAPAIGLRVDSVWTSGMPLRLNQKVDRRMLTRASRGRVIENIRRIGKYLLLDFQDSNYSVLVHLGMSGRLRLVDAASAQAAHTHVIFRTSGSAKRPGRTPEVRYSDPRRFGQVTWVHRGREREHPALARIGLDPLVEQLTGAHLHERMKKTARPIKIFLLDQQAVAGVGNIYASEALWQARIRPATPANRISRKRADALAAAIIDVFDRALDHGGTSLRDFVNADGREGTHAHYLWVYDREGSPCLRPECQTPIRRTVMQNRATFHCPRCQRR